MFGCWEEDEKVVSVGLKESKYLITQEHTRWHKSIQHKLKRKDDPIKSGFGAFCSCSSSGGI